MLLLDDIKSQAIPPRCLDAKKLLITGPVGVGKTTIAKALAVRAMGVEQMMRDAATNRPKLPEDRWDLAEAFPFDVFHVNGGDDGIDRIRQLAEASRQSPSSPDARCRAFIVDEVHALPDKAIQALKIPLEDDKVNFWVACTDRPAGSLDRAIRSRLSCHLDLGAADVRAVMLARGCSEAEAAAAAKSAQGDLRLALGGGAVGVSDDLGGIVQMRPGSSFDPKLGSHPYPRLVGDARRLLSLAVRSPFAVQAAILDVLVDYPEQHTQMCVQLSPRNDIAAHQLVAAARKARLL